MQQNIISSHRIYTIQASFFVFLYILRSANALMLQLVATVIQNCMMTMHHILTKHFMYTKGHIALGFGITVM
jgi:hypothetical protein